MLPTFGNSLWTFLFPVILLAENVGAVQIGLVYTTVLIVLMFAQVPVGIFADRYGRKATIVVGGVITTISALIIGYSSAGLITAVGYIMFSGVGSAFLGIGVTTLIIESVSKDRIATGYGTFVAIAGWASVIAPTLGGLEIVNHKTELLTLSATLYTIALALRARLLKETLPSKDDSSPTEGEKVVTPASGFARIRLSLESVLSNKALLLIAITYVIYNMFFGQLSFIITVFSQETLHLSTATIGVMFSIWLLLDSQSSLFFGRLADQYDKTKIIMVSWFGETVLMMIFAYSINATFALISFGLWTLFGTLDGPALIAIYGQITQSESRGLSFGIINTFGQVAALPIPLLAAVLYQTSPRLPFYLQLITNCAAFLFLVKVAFPRFRNTPVST